MMSGTIEIDSNHKTATGRRYYLMIARQKAYLILIAIWVHHAILFLRGNFIIEESEEEMKVKSQSFLDRLETS